MSRPLYHEGRRAGVRLAIEWLHARALEMNDPHAQDILNGAGFALGSDLAGGSLVKAKTLPEEIAGLCIAAGYQKMFTEAELDEIFQTGAKKETKE